MSLQKLGGVVLIFLAGGLATGLMWLFWIRVFMKWERWRNRMRKDI